MNLVFGSLFLFILISPGLIFRFSYLQGTYAKLTFKVSAVEEIFWALIPAFFLQSAAIIIVQEFWGCDINLEVIYQLITGGKDVDFILIQKDLTAFLLYITVLLIISVVLGITGRSLVRKYKLDLKLKFLRFGNEWYYLFSGEVFYHSKKLEPANIFLIQIDVMVSSSEGDIIYSGILEDFYLSKDNGLDRIYLRNVYRRNLKDDLEQNTPSPGFLNRSSDERYYAMPGDLFVITYNKIINLNITYIKLDTIEIPELDESDPEQEHPIH
jgi:hypothetical protein